MNESTSERVASADSARFCEAALKKGFVATIRILECSKIASSPEGQGKTPARILLEKGYLSPVQAEEVLRQILPPPVPEIPGYGPLSPAGEDRFGELYLSHHLAADLDVQIRIVKVQIAQVEFEPLMLLARRLTSLGHPALVPLLDAGQVEGGLFVATETLRDAPLAKSLEGGLPMSQDSVLDMAGTLIEGLLKLKEEGFCHGGVTPDTIVLKNGKARLTLPGLAYLVHKAAPALIKEFGSPAYMAPEQHEGKLATTATDLYSLGLVLYHCAAGLPAFTATTLAGLAQAKEDGAFVPLHEAAAQISPGFSRFISDLIHPDPAKRPQTREALFRGLQSASQALVEPKPEPLLAELVYDPKGPPAKPSPVRAKTSQAKPATIRSRAAAEPGAAAWPVRPRPLAGRSKPEETPVSAGAANRKKFLLIGGGVGLVLLVGVLIFVLGGKKSRPYHAAKQAPTAPAERSEPRRSALEEARDLFARIQPKAIDEPLSKGNFADALAALASFEARHPEFKSDADTLREEIQRQAKRDLEQVKRRIVSAGAAGRNQEAAEIASDARSRYRGIEGLEQEVGSILASSLRKPEPPQPAGAPRGPSNEILANADSALGEAKKEYEEGIARASAVLLDSSLLKAEKARTGYQAVQEVLTGKDKERAVAQLGVTTQLIRLVSDARKTVARGGLPASGAAPSPAPANKPDAAAWDAARTVLARFASDASFKAAAEVGKAREAARSGGDEFLLATAAILTIAAEDAASVPEAEKKAVGEYLKKVDWKTNADHPKAVLQLEEAKAKVRETSAASGQALVFLQMAHANQVLRSAGSSPATVSTMQKIGLQTPDPKEPGIFATPTAAAMSRAKKLGEGKDEALAELKKFTGSDPALVFFRAYGQLLNLLAKPAEEKKKGMAALAQVFRDLRPPEGQKRAAKFIAEALRTVIPCSTCKGEHSVKCSSCDKGEVKAVCNQCGGKGGSGTLKCSVCNGTGNYVDQTFGVFIFPGQGGQLLNTKCPVCTGKGYTIQNPCPACGAKGTWKVKCAKCKGEGKTDCRGCKAPWAEPTEEDLFVSVACPLCRETGFLYDSALVPCPGCAGVGRILEPPKSKK